MSVAGNVGHVLGHSGADRVTAAVPPLAAAAALAVGLGVLKRVVEHHHEAAQGPLTSVPPDVQGAALAALRATTAAGNPLSGRQLETRFGLSRADVTRARELVAAEQPSDAAGAPSSPPMGASRPPQSALNGNGGAPS